MNSAGVFTLTIIGKTLSKVVLTFRFLALVFFNKGRILWP